MFSVLSVHVQPITFETSHIERSFLVYRYIFGIFMSNLSINVILSMSRSRILLTEWVVWIWLKSILVLGVWSAHWSYFKGFIAILCGISCYIPKVILMWLTMILFFWIKSRAFIIWQFTLNPISLAEWRQNQVPVHLVIAQKN